MTEVDGDVDMLASSNTTEQQQKAKQCFSLIQNRKLASALAPSACQLCPSMDLLVLAVGDTVWIHRTVSWQRLATWKLEEEEEDCQVVSVCWAPDGRSLAVALTNGTIALHHVEALSSEEDIGAMHTIVLPRVVSLAWAHVGRPHPSCPLGKGEIERQVTWQYQSRYLDRASTFLPPSSHHVPDSLGGESMGVVQTTRPSCQTPLSLFCATTQDHKIYLYLYGQYAIATLTCTDLPRNMVCTADLRNLIVMSGSSRLTLYHLPALATYRYPLQVISSLYCSMVSHLAAMEQGIQEVSTAWKSSLKPLDTKLEALKRLLKNYDVSKDVRTVLYEFLVKGCAEDDPVTNALEAFFSNVQMNDQLIQRLERSLHNAVANVETLARRGLVAPALALAYEAGDLQSEPLVGSRASVKLQRASHVLVLSAQDLVARMVEARFRLRDLVSWLRSAGSQVKARGTPQDSGQRENAKKRRVCHAIVERMAMYLQGDFKGETDSVTESLIGITITEFFSNDQDFMVARRPSSPKSIDILGRTTSSGSKRPTVVFAFKRARQIMNTVFEQPKSFVFQSITQQDFAFSPARDESCSVCAIHSRLGGNPNSGSDDPASFFSPRVASDDAPVGCCRSWAIVARVADFQGGTGNSVHIFALPLGWKDDLALDDDMDDDEEHCNVPFYLSCCLALPASYRVKEIAFYGDDGNSSLSVGTDIDDGTGKEGRQAMGLLVSCPLTDDDTNLTAEELWLVKYDHAIYHGVSLPSGRDGNESSARLDEQVLTNETVVSVQPLQESQNEDAVDNHGVIYAKTRRISLKETESSSRILLSGSRGVGGVLITASSHVELDVFDLEEDVDDDASEDEE